MCEVDSGWSMVGCVSGREVVLKTGGVCVDVERLLNQTELCQ